MFCPTAQPSSDPDIATELTSASGIVACTVQTPPASCRMTLPGGVGWPGALCPGPVDDDAELPFPPDAGGGVPDAEPPAWNSTAATHASPSGRAAIPVKFSTVFAGIAPAGRACTRQAVPS